MAGVATLTTKLKVTGLGSDLNVEVEKIITVPVEEAGSKTTIIATAQTTALQISDLAPQIALAKMYCLYIKAVVGTIYVQVDTAGTTTFAAAAAHHVINEGEAYTLPLNPAGNLGVAIDADAVTNSMEWHLLGKA